MRWPPSGWQWREAGPPRALRASEPPSPTPGEARNAGFSRNQNQLRTPQPESRSPKLVSHFRLDPKRETRSPLPNGWRSLGQLLGSLWGVERLSLSRSPALSLTLSLALSLLKSEVRGQRSFHQKSTCLHAIDLRALCGANWGTPPSPLGGGVPILGLYVVQI